MTTMIDQAAELRRLLLRTSDNSPSALPKSLVVSGGKPGVGATTLAVNLARTLAGDALRIVLIDADLAQADVADRCSAAGGFGIGDVLAGRKNIHEALVRGPAGMQILPGTATAEARDTLARRPVERLVKQVGSLAPHSDWLVIDAGHEPTELTARLWNAAEHVLLVTSPDAAAVMDTYALVKTLLSRQPLQRPLALVVNLAANELEAADVWRRIDQSCRRFLGLTVKLAGWMPVTHSFRSDSPAHDPKSPLAAAVGRLAQSLTAPRPPAHATRRLAA